MNKLTITLLSGLLSILGTLSVHAHGDAIAIGDGKVTTAPQTSSIYSCVTSFHGGGAFQDGPWIRNGFWYPAEKPAVSGAVEWPQHQQTISLNGDMRVVTSNGLPSHLTGIFPIQSSDTAYQYDRNPNHITAQTIFLTLPANPVIAATPTCVGMGMIGITISGVALFNGLDAGGRDAAAHEIQDACNGHPQPEGMYHYHADSPCLKDDNGKAGKHSDLVGYALDGFGIYGEHGDDGVTLHSASLDMCHGHTHAIMWDGKLVQMYHYHLTDDYPYSLGCYRGTPAATQQAAHGGNGGGMGSHGMSMQTGQGHGAPGQALPQGQGRKIIESAAQQLGIDAAALGQAVGPPPPDFDRAAQMLGISADKIRAAFESARRGAGFVGP